MRADDAKNVSANPKKEVIASASIEAPVAAPMLTRVDIDKMLALLKLWDPQFKGYCCFIYGHVKFERVVLLISQFSLNFPQDNG